MIRDCVEAELRRIVDDDVIVPVTTPTRWVSALLEVVIAKQDGNLRICIDPKPLNRASQPVISIMDITRL